MKTLVLLFVLVFSSATSAQIIDAETANIIQIEKQKYLEQNAVRDINNALENKSASHHGNGQGYSNIHSGAMNSVGDKNSCPQVGTIKYVTSCLPKPITPGCDCQYAQEARDHLRTNTLEVASDESEESEKSADDSDETVSGIGSLDGMFTCDNSGSFNQDYSSCKKAITAYNAIYTFDKANQVYTQTEMQNFSNNLKQQALMDSQMGNIQSASFDYRVQELDKRKSILSRTRAFYIAQGGALAYVVKKEWPTGNSTMRKCVTGSDARMQGEGEEQFEVDIQNENDPMVTTCDKFMSLYEEELFKNKHILNGLTQYEISLGQKVIALSGQISNLNKQIAQLKNFKDNAFAEDGTVAPQGYAAFCQTNPNDARCQLAAGRPDLANFGQGGLNFQGGTGGQLSFGDENGNPLGGSDSDKNAELAEGLENILGGPGEAGSGSSKPIDAPRAAKAGDPAAGGGGGGALGGGGGGAPAAPGITPESEAGTEPKEEKKDLKVADYNPYGGKKRGIRIFSGGSKKKKDSKNPFRDALGKLGKKKKNRAVASMDTLPKDIDLFKKISGRYAQLSKDKLIASPEKKSGKSK